MPLIGKTSKKRVELQHQIMVELESKCVNCKLFEGMSMDNLYIYTVDDRNHEETGIVGVAQYDDCKSYAVYIPESFNEERLRVFEFLLREVREYAEEGETIVVFSQRDYDAVMKYNHGDPIINVKLCI